MTVEELAREAVDCGFRIHSDVGPGLLESVYEAILAKALQARGLRVERQVPVPVAYHDLKFDEGFRADILVNDLLIIEVKSVEKSAPVHPKQVLTYLRLLDRPLGLLMNFGAPLFKDGLQRIVNKHTDFRSSGLRLHTHGDSREAARNAKRE